MEVIERATANMKKFTPRTLRNLKELKQDLERVRHLGYAINRGEWRDGVCGIAAPIRDASGSVVAAVGLSGPSARINANGMRDLGVVVMRAAAGISRSLGASKLASASNAGTVSSTRRRSSQQTKSNTRMNAL
jgi:DNA-binding IclR family transcriptional regulator